MSAQHQHHSCRFTRCIAWTGLTGLLLLTLSGCLWKPVATKTPVNGVPASVDYVIDAGDVLEILVWRNEALSRIVTVRPDGKISLPLINDVQASGLTPMTLREQIAQELKKFKEIPEVSVIVKEANSQVVYILGQVAKPGTYPLAANATVLQMVAQAGGFTPFANRNSIVVMRRGENGGREQRIPVSYRAILTGRSTNGNVVLHAGDTIVVP